MSGTTGAADTRRDEDETRVPLQPLKVPGLRPRTGHAAPAQPGPAGRPGQQNPGQQIPGQGMPGQGAGPTGQPGPGRNPRQSPGQFPGQPSGEAADAPPRGPAAAPVLAPALALTPGGLAVFAGRLVLGGPDRILSADAATGRGWRTAWAAPRRALDQTTGPLAQTLGFVEDGPAAAAMRVEVPGHFGTGPFAVFQGAGDAAPCLYAVTRSLWGGRVLRSEDGARFDEVKSPAGLSRPGHMALAGPVVAGGWLVTAPAPVPAAARGAGAVAPDEPVTIHAARDPAHGAWGQAAPEGFGAGLTGGITALGIAHGRVHAAVADPHRGFSLWSAVPGDTLPWTWERTIDRGAWRYSHNPQVTAMAEFGGALYLAAGISDSGFGTDRAGPAAAEILRLNADGSWDLIVGNPRFTPAGLKVPLSGMGPGFDDGYATLVPALAVHDGRLHAGTRNARSDWQLRQTPDIAPAEIDGGAALWSSADGETWEPAMLAGGGDPALASVAALAADAETLWGAVTIGLAVEARLQGRRTGGGAEGAAGEDPSGTAIAVRRLV